MPQHRQVCNPYKCDCGSTRFSDYRITVSVFGVGERLFEFRKCNVCKRITVIDTPGGLVELPEDLRQWFPKTIRVGLSDDEYIALLEMLVELVYIRDAVQYLYKQSKANLLSDILGFLTTSDPYKDYNRYLTLAKMARRHIQAKAEAKRKRSE